MKLWTTGILQFILSHTLVHSTPINLNVYFYVTKNGTKTNFMRKYFREKRNSEILTYINVAFLEAD